MLTRAGMKKRGHQDIESQRAWSAENGTAGLLAFKIAGSTTSAIQPRSDSLSAASQPS